MSALVHRASQLGNRFVTLYATIKRGRLCIICAMPRGYGHHFIRQWREFRHLSLRQLEARLEIEPGGDPLVSYASLGRIERGLQPYSQPILEAVALALNTTPAALLEVDPTKAGVVVDLLKHLPDDKRQEAERYIRYLANR